MLSTLCKFEHTRQFVLLGLLLTFTCTIGFNDRVEAKGNRAGMGHRRVVKEEVTRQPVNEEPQADDEEVVERQSEGRPESETRASENREEGGLGAGLKSSLEDRFKPQAGQDGISLFNVVGNILEIGFLIFLLVSVPIGGSVGFCAMIWHAQKMFNGGKKPSIG